MGNFIVIHPDHETIKFKFFYFLIYNSTHYSVKNDINFVKTELSIRILWIVLSLDT